MPDIIQQLLDLKEWSQDSARYERRMNFRAGQLVQPGPEGVRQGYGEKFKKQLIQKRLAAREAAHRSPGASKQSSVTTNSWMCVLGSRIFWRELLELCTNSAPQFQRGICHSFSGES